MTTDDEIREVSKTAGDVLASRIMGGSASQNNAIGLALVLMLVKRLDRIASTLEEMLEDE